MAESNRVVSRLMSFILLFDCQEAFHCCLVVACSNRINMISIQCHRVGEWSAGKPECGNCIVPVWGNHAGLNEVAIPFKWRKTWNDTSTSILDLPQNPKTTLGDMAGVLTMHAIY